MKNSLNFFRKLLEDFIAEFNYSSIGDKSKLREKFHVDIKLKI